LKLSLISVIITQIYLVSVQGWFTMRAGHIVIT
jgi:hypothetical protein